MWEEKGGIHTRGDLCPPPPITASEVIAAAAEAFISVNSISQRKIKHQYNKMVQLNTAVQIGYFQHLYLT